MLYAIVCVKTDVLKKLLISNGPLWLESIQPENSHITTTNNKNYDYHNYILTSTTTVLLWLVSTAKKRSPLEILSHLAFTVPTLVFLDLHSSSGSYDALHFIHKFGLQHVAKDSINKHQWIKMKCGLALRLCFFLSRYIGVTLPYPNWPPAVWLPSPPSPSCPCSIRQPPIGEPAGLSSCICGPPSCEFELWQHCEGVPQQEADGPTF